MAVTTDILRSYRRPREVFAGLLARGFEDRTALIFLVAAMGLGFVSSLPGVQREAHMPNPDLEARIRSEAGDVRRIEGLEVPENMIEAKFQALLSAELLVWFFILPLFFYAVAFVSGLILRGFGWQLDGVSTRLALFWALLVASPLMLLYGLVYGIIGAGAAYTLVGAIWFGVFLWNWIANLRTARGEAA